MKNFRYKFPVPKENFQDEHMTPLRQEKNKQKTIASTEKMTAEKTNTVFARLDNKASIVNGKLVFIDTELKSIG